jgi:putative methylase
MNPPFGTKRPHADVDFLQAALDLSRVVYSIHKTSTRQFLQGWLHRHHAAGTVLMSTELEIKHQFSFHTKKKQYVAVDVFRIKPR